MRFLGLAVATGAALVLSACAKKADTPAADSTPAAPAMAAPTATVAPMPITGKTWEVKMVGEGTTYKYDPAELTIAPGDGIKFIMVSNGPHNVAFDPAQPAFTASPASKAQLIANMTEPVSELSSPYLIAPNAEYVLSFAGVAPGTYDFFCTPHLQMNMRGKVTVK
ncbi:MAG: plastocyanin/azurin family copper-binding protein [Gemmatimonas sp.]